MKRHDVVDENGTLQVDLEITGLLLRSRKPMANNFVTLWHSGIIILKTNELNRTLK